MTILLLAFFFINTTIWYYISYNLSKKSITTLTLAEKNDVDDIICYKCGIERSSDYLKQKYFKTRIKFIKILNVEGYFCEDCSQYYYHVSLGTILLTPLVYFLCIMLVIPLLNSINLFYIPKSWHYLMYTIFPVIILTFFVCVFYSNKISSKLSKIYYSKEKNP